mgnify:CR=1 FL=1
MKLLKEVKAYWLSWTIKERCWFIWKIVTFPIWISLWGLAIASFYTMSLFIHLSFRGAMEETKDLF